MSKLLRFLFLLLLLAAVALPAGASAQPDYIRLHIIANSDSLIDQSVKLCIRDDIRTLTSSLLADCDDSDTAWQILWENQNDLLTTAQKSARRYGFHGDVSLEMGVFPFPDRTYGNELVPAGDYRALRITLGSGEGRNWWCVVYPSLCLPEDADTDKPVEFYSFICRWAVKIWEAITQ